MGNGEKTAVLGVNFDVVTMDGAVEKALSFLREDKPHTIFTPNPEIVLEARKNKAFKDILNSADLLIPDGIGVVYASRLNKVKIRQRVPGYDLLLNIFNEIRNTGETVYFFGGAPGVAELAKLKMEERFPGLKIVGASDGYFDAEKERFIINDIITKKPDILLAGLGFPKQETWIHEHKGVLPAKILIGVGGTLDGYSGKFRRSPVIWQKLGLEWFHRLIRDPKRFKRQLKLPLFVLIVLKEKIFGAEKQDNP